MRSIRPSIARVALLAFALLAPASSTLVRADEVAVPVSVQTGLLFMVAAHDRNLVARAGDAVRTVVLVKGGAADKVAAQFKASASATSTVAGLPLTVEVMPFAGAQALAEACRTRRISLVYLVPGFTDEEITAIGHALDGGNVLTVGATPGMVQRGVVLGFDLVAGRTRLIVDLVQATKQKVAFGPDVLRLMAVSR